MSIGRISIEKRGRNVALFGLFVQFSLALALGLLYVFNLLEARSISQPGWTWPALYSAIHLMFGGIILWISLIVIYFQRVKVAEEALESQEIERDRRSAGTSGIFDADQEEWLVAQRRLKWIYRWVLPIFVLATIFFLLFNGLSMWGSTLSQDLKDTELWHDVPLGTVSMFFVGGVALLAFLFSRYLSGMSREQEWRTFKSCSIYLFGNAAVCLAMVICLMLQSAFPMANGILACAITILFLLLAAEFLVNFILDFYRPRQPDEALRPAFESRLIGLISEPGGIARSIAEAVNYQFGFDVSATWFYRLIEESVVRLLALAVIVLMIMTCFTVVDADEMAYVERWGRRLSQEPIGPGWHCKAPWPIDKVRKANVSLIQQVIVGEAGSNEEEQQRKEMEQGIRERVLTWTKEHDFVPYTDVLVATPDTESMSEGHETEGIDGQEQAVAVSVLRISMPVQYHVKKQTEGFKNYIYNFEDPRQMLKDIAYRELCKQAVNFDYKKVMSEERGQVAEKLMENIQSECDRMSLGVDIIYVGLQEVHPPTEGDVAQAFQAVATAQQQKETLIQSAKIVYTGALVATAGEEIRAERIDAFIEVKDLVDSKKPEQALQRIDELLNSSKEKYSELVPIRERLASGEEASLIVEQMETHIRDNMLGNTDKNIMPIRGVAGELLARARANALAKVNNAASLAINFELENKAFQASPRLYKMRKALQILSGELDQVRKYVVMVDATKTNVIIEIDEKDTTGLEIVNQSKNP